MSFYKKNRKTIHIVAGIAIGITAITLLLPKRDTTGGDKDDFNPTQVSDQLKALMDQLGKGALLGKSEEIMLILKKIPENRFFEVYNIFGKPKYNWVTGGVALGSERDLIYWLNNELEAEHYKTLKTWFPNVTWI